MPNTFHRQAKEALRRTRLLRHGGIADHPSSEDERIAWENFRSRWWPEVSLEDVRVLVPQAIELEETQAAIERRLKELASALRMTERGGNSTWSRASRMVYRNWVDAAPIHAVASWLGGKDRDLSVRESRATLELSHRAVIGARIEGALIEHSSVPDRHKAVFDQIDKHANRGAGWTLVQKALKRTGLGNPLRDKVDQALDARTPTVAERTLVQMDDVVDRFTQSGDRPFVQNAIKFEISCGALDETDGAHRVLQGLVETSGMESDPAQAMISRVPKALDRLSTQGGKEVAYREFYNGVLRHLKEKARRAYDSREHTFPEDFEIMEGLDGVTALGAAVYRGAQLGIPLSILAEWIESGIPTHSGTVELGPKERDELLHIAFSGAREYAQESVVWQKSYLSEEVKSLLHEAEELVRSLQVEGDSTILSSLELLVKQAIDNEQLDPQDKKVALRQAHTLVLKLRAQQEVRRVTYGHANDRLGEILRDINSLPHLKATGHPELAKDFYRNKPALPEITLHHLVEKGSLAAGRWRSDVIDREHDRMPFRAPNDRVEATDPSLARRLPNRVARRDRAEARKARIQRERERAVPG